MQITLKETRLGLRNSATRLPFRYGKACLTRCPQAVMSAVIGTGKGRVQTGFSGDCLPPSWFDKSPDKDFSQQIDDMLAAMALAQQCFADELAQPGPFFQAWLSVYHQLHQWAGQQSLPPLLATFGLSMVERAILDAMARAAGLSFAAAVRGNLYAIDAGEAHPVLAGVAPADWLPPTPTTSVLVRHTVGLADPLTDDDISPSERLDDGFPQSLDEYVARCGLQYFKIKVSNNLSADLQRLQQIAALVEQHRGADYRVTLDGNEQYKQADQFDELIDAIRAQPELRTLWANTLLIEQPLDRRIALAPAHTAGVRELSRTKPVIIDESDSDLAAYPRAVELGYRGVSSKNCKSPIKSVLNAGLTHLYNQRGDGPHVMTGEDLCTVGVIPVQSDLCLTATLGLSHVERNGHHYHRGLGYLPPSQQQAALVAHGDFYAEIDGVVAPRLVDGRFRIASLQCDGFGFAVEPDFDSMQSPSEWDFRSLEVSA